MDARMSPDFSPSMLQFFLQARCLHQVNAGISRDIKAARVTLRKSARVTSAAFDVAWGGRLNKAETRCKLWGALGVVPADHGVTLTDDGGQSLASRAAPHPSDAGPPAGRETVRGGRSAAWPLAGADDGRNAKGAKA